MFSTAAVSVISKTRCCRVDGVFAKQPAVSQFDRSGSSTTLPDRFDGQALVRICVQPGYGLADDPAVDIVYLAGALSNWNEPIGVDELVPVPHPDQHFVSRDPVAADVDDGLVVEQEAVLLEGLGDTPAPRRCWSTESPGIHPLAKTGASVPGPCAWPGNMLMSALAMSTFTSSPCCGNRAMPMLQETAWRLFSVVNSIWRSVSSSFSRQCDGLCLLAGRYDDGEFVAPRDGRTGSGRADGAVDGKGDAT